MNTELLGAIDKSRQHAIKQAEYAHVVSELYDHSNADIDTELIQRTAYILQLAVLDILREQFDENDEAKLQNLKQTAADAFRLFQTLPIPSDDLEAGKFMLRAGTLAILGDKGGDAARWLRDVSWSTLSIDDADWRRRTWATVIDIWLRLIRKNGWSDRDTVLEQVAGLRESQLNFEKEYLENIDLADAKPAALELIGLYHLARSAEIFALYMTDGVVEGKFQIGQLMDTHFDRALAVCNESQMVDLELLCRLLTACASQMTKNSIWTVTRAVNTRVTDFVQSLVDRGRGDRVIFDVLPPQRRALAEQGLLGSSRRAVVVSLPTSSGKTLIAEFRILQALNQFEHEKGWVAYLTPTRALVNQITRQLRRDLEPLDIIVEKVSPALEVDNVESELLRQQSSDNAFRVLVATPEKLDLMLRQNWEEEIGRPLTLVVVDEAHNIQNSTRGIRLELLLATINNECQRAQFLLLTPFIENAREIAQWLGGMNSEDISLALEWQPNDRVIGIIQPEKLKAINDRSHDYQLRMETVHTTRKTLVVDELLKLTKNTEIASTYRKVCNPRTLAAVAAQDLQHRGAVIVMHTRPDWVWSLANLLKIDTNFKTESAQIKLVQEFLKLELGPTFPLIDLLSYGIGVHHAGLSDDVRTLMEWLFEEDELRFLVATTTIAQGVNFPVSGVVMASHQYPYGSDMPPEDFWNIAGRAGRISQERLGVITLVADTPDKAEKLRAFVNRQTGALNSALIELVVKSRDKLDDLGAIVYSQPEWSGFLQYLAHTYRQMGRPESFTDDVERILRGTLGFEKLRENDLSLANRFLDGVYSYTKYIQEPRQPIELVDSTGFSLQSVRTALNAVRQEGISAKSWNADSLFSDGNRELQGMMGVLLRVPELRGNLDFAIGGQSSDGNKLALVVKDWVNGLSVSEIAHRYFWEDGRDELAAITTCGQNIFGRVNQTVAWGLGALLSITGGDLSENEMQSVRNLPSYVYYGVNNDNAIALRLIGVSRNAATKLAADMGEIHDEQLARIRSNLRNVDKTVWQNTLGEHAGAIYREVWHVLEGLD